MRQPFEGYRSGSARRGVGCDPIEFLHLITGQLEVGRSQVFAQMLDRRGAGDEQHVWRPLKEPRQRRLHRRDAEAPRDFGQSRRLQRRESAEREERHVSRTGRGEFVDQRIVVTMGNVVMVLDADDVADPAPFGDLRRR